MSNAKPLVHLVRRWSGLRDDESPLCGLPADECFATRTVFSSTVTCPECLAKAKELGNGR